jgi:lipoate-protein ligase A
LALDSEKYLKMFLIDNLKINDPRINLALEEYCLRNLDLENEYLLLYVNEPSVIIGRHQNVLEEINHRFVMEKGIRVVRRISGGGAVYHDYGNLNYSFVRQYEHNTLVNIKGIMHPIVAALNRLGVPGIVNDRNDIIVHGKKISGNAQFSNTKGIIIHGTLLFDSELDSEEKALDVNQTHIESKALKSIRSDVANISSFLETPMDMEGFRNHLCNTMDEIHGGLKVFTLAGKDWDNVYALSEKKYNSWDWNFGKSPEFIVWKTVPFNFGDIDTRIDVKKGAIENIRFNGGLGVGPESIDLVRSLKGQRYEGKAIKSALKNVDLDHCLGDITVDKFVESIY